MVKTSRIFSVCVANKVNKEEQCQQCFISISPEIIMLVVSVMSVIGIPPSSRIRGSTIGDTRHYPKMILENNVTEVYRPV